MSKPDNPPTTQGLDFHTGTSVPESRQVAFPANEKVEPRVMIETRVFEDLLAHGRETTAVELCGVLVGTTRRDSTGPYLLIDGSIRGQHTRNDGAQVTFTHETWDHIHRQMESSFKNKSIVGWYHTHPGFGIFLSDMDKFIQDYFFNQPFQVALVIDPISSKEGLFAWIDGKTRPLSRCWIGKDVRKLTAGAVGSAETRDTPPPGKAGAQLVIERRPSKSDAAEVVPDNIINYSSLIPVVLAFILGLGTAFLAMRGMMLQSAVMASRAETRELLSSWAADTAAVEDWRLLHSRLEQLAGRSRDVIDGSGAYAVSGASFAGEIDEISDRMAGIASASAARKAKVQSILANLPPSAVSSEEYMGQIQEQVRQIRGALGECFLMQLAPYLEAVAAGSIDKVRLAYAKRLTRLIIEMNPGLEPELRVKFPGLFQ